MYNGDDRSSSPRSENTLVQDEVENDMEDLVLNGDLELLEAELKFDPLSSDGSQRMDVDAPNNVKNTTNSDDLFDVTFDELNPEELEALDLSSNVATLSAQLSGHEVGEEEDLLFADGFDELMNLDFDETQSQVCQLLSNLP